MQKITFEDLPSTDTPVNATNLNQLQTNVENAIPTRTKLWENQNPTSSMASGTEITLSSDNYDELVIYYKETKNSSYMYSNNVVKGYGTRISCGFAPSDVGIAYYSREAAYTSDTKLTVYDARYFYGNNWTSKGVNNDLCIPVYVYGIKY